MKRIRSLAITIIALGALAASVTPAGASQYGNLPPSFDGLAMLRVAYAYNVTKAYDLSFPADSDEACEIAGVATMTFVSKDHGPWLNGPGYDVMKASLDEALAANPDPHVRPCYWLQSESAADFFNGLPRVWMATLKPGFKHLRKALRRGGCKNITERLGNYPPVALPRDRLRSKIRAAAGGTCKRR